MLNPNSNLIKKTKPIFTLIILLFIIVCQSLAQTNQERVYKVKIKLQPEQDIESIYELMPSIQLVQKQDNTYETEMDARTFQLLRSLSVDYEVLKIPSSIIKMEKTNNLRPGMANPLIQNMVRAVSIDSLRTQILALQNFGTRFEYTPQQDSAGVYIYNEFTRWGLQAEFDTYSFGLTTLYDIDFASQDKGWIVGSKGMITATTNGGENWINNNSNITTDLFGVDFVNNLRGWCVGANGRILTTTDGGTTWTQQTSGISSAIYDIGFVNEQLGIAVGEAGSILRTTNGGVNWTIIPSGTSNLLRELKFVDTLTAWTVGRNGTIRQTTNGGLNWSAQTPPPGVTSYLRAVDFVNPQYGWIVGDGRTILKTTDGGTSWIKKIPPAGIDTILRGVSFIDSLRGWVVDYHGRILATTDGGENWSIQYTHLGWRAYLTNVKAIDENRILVCGAYGNLYLSTNSGTNWIRKTSTLPSQYIHTSNNIVATISGKVTPEKECIIVAHYDSYSNDPYNNAPGADDNGTGTAAVMEAARICRNYNFESTIKFLAVSGEELGMFGSDHYAFKARDEGRNIIGVVNGDMIGYPTTSDTARLIAGSYQTYNRLIDSAIAVNQRYNIGLNLLSIIDFTGASDYGPFALAGYDALDVAEATAEEIWGGANPHYHRTTDTYDKLKPSLIRRGAQLMLATVAELAKPITDTVTISFQVNDKWNMVSVPVQPESFIKSNLFPSAVTPAFRYENGYIASDTLKCGTGYWLKFEDAENIFIRGIPYKLDSINVTEGWNLIGSLSEDIDVNTITTHPPNIIVSSFFGFNRGYFITDKIKRGKAHWVKVRKAGKMILKTSE